MDRGLRARGSPIARNICEWTANLYQITNWEVQGRQFYPTKDMPDRYSLVGFREKLIKEGWLINVLSGTPETPRGSQVHSIYYSSAKEMEENPQLKDRTYDFKNVYPWRDVALQALVHAGWRPDCAISQRRNIQKSLPPHDPHGRLVFSTMTHMRDIPLGEGHGSSYGAWLREENGGLQVTSGAFFQDNIGYSVTWEKDATTGVATHGWIIGYDAISQQPPVAITEGSLLHALRRVQSYLNTEHSFPEYRYIGLRAGNAETQKSLER